MDVEKTIEFLLGHQARMAAENELFHEHQAAVRAEHEDRFKQLQIAQLDLSEMDARLGKRIDHLVGILGDVTEANREEWTRYKEGEARHKESEARYKEGEARHKENEARYKESEARYKAEREELHKHMDERLNALIQIVDEMIRHRPQQ